ncbi:MAG: patatin-like phospholipase family protein, partial [Frankiales bacterium]|nr:patatin-like phospholipase family protein [Frankiales bacterium]
MRGGPPVAEHKNAPASATTSRPTPVLGQRALILGGGGSAGNAWEIGVIAGLLEVGLDVTEADLVIGTSAGATTAAQVTSATPSGLLAAILGAEAAPAPPIRSGGGPPPAGSAAEHLDRTSRLIAASTCPADMRRRMGAAALELEAASDSDWSTRWRATVALRLPSPAWPETTVRLVAVDARTGAPVVFDRHSGVDLVDAVA